jgi:protein-S-isoprenylcysteine O-methyltransferase Ste14
MLKTGKRSTLLHYLIYFLNMTVNYFFMKICFANLQAETINPTGTSLLTSLLYSYTHAHTRTLEIY